VCSPDTHNAHSDVNKLWAVAQACVQDSRGQNRGQNSPNRPKQAAMDDSQWLINKSVQSNFRLITQRSEVQILPPQFRAAISDPFSLRCEHQSPFLWH
jgi:hypothetical protein